MNNLPRIFFILGILLVLIGIGIIYSSYHTAQAPTAEQVATTTTTTTTTAPVTTTEPGWKTYSDSSASFQYPAELPTTYIHASEWPPKLSVTSEGDVCAALKGETQRVTINGREYCITSSSEGAAGSTYTTLDYATKVGGKVVLLTFTLRVVQCANYDEPQKAACLQERANFNVGKFIDRIIQTVVLK